MDFNIKTKKISEMPSISVLDDTAVLQVVQGSTNYKILATDLEYAGVNVQSDWAETNVDDYAYILNKPDLSLKVDTNGLNANIDKLHFNTNTTTPIAYDLYKNVDEQTLSIKLPDGGSLEIGKEMFENYTNIDTVPLVNGDVVSIVQITGNRRGIKRCDPTSDNARTAVGMVTVPSIAVNGSGRVSTMGNIHELNTNAFTEGIPIYVDPANPGKLTQTFPAAPNYVVEVGAVEVSHLTQGVVNLNIRTYPKLSDLSDVNGTPLSTDGQIPVWHNTTKLFDFDKNINNYRLLSNNVFGDVTNNSTFEADGTLKMNGTATVYDDLTSDITRAKTIGTRVTFNDAEMSIDFSSTATLSDYIVMSYQLSHRYKIGSTIYPHVHWEQNSSNTPNWLLQYRWQTLGGAKVTSWTNYKSNVNALPYASGTISQISHDGGIIAPVGAGTSDIIQLRLIRDTANASGLFTGADNYTGTVSVLAADIHFEIDSLGSHTEYSK